MGITMISILYLNTSWESASGASVLGRSASLVCRRCLKLLLKETSLAVDEEWGTLKQHNHRPKKQQQCLKNHLETSCNQETLCHLSRFFASIQRLHLLVAANGGWGHLSRNLVLKRLTSEICRWCTTKASKAPGIWWAWCDCSWHTSRMA